jgi:hypothetical protein
MEGATSRYDVTHPSLDDHRSQTFSRQWEIRNSDGDEHWFVRSRVGRWLGVEGSLANSTRIEPLEREFEWTILRESHIFRCAAGHRIVIVD